jgi:hypothetical protein
MIHSLVTDIAVYHNYVLIWVNKTIVLRLLLDDDDDDIIPTYRIRIIIVEISDQLDIWQTCRN